MVSFRSSLGLFLFAGCTAAGCSGSSDPGAAGTDGIESTGGGATADTAGPATAGSSGGGISSGGASAGGSGSSQGSTTSGPGGATAGAIGGGESSTSGASTSTTGTSGGATTGGSGRDGGATGTTGGSAAGCGGAVTLHANPFGCSFAWGGTNTQAASYLAFITKWVGYEANGGLNGACDGCSFAKSLASTNAIPVYYAYFIGYQANQQGGFGDCNTDKDGHNLCTDGAQWIKNNRAAAVQMYANYAQKSRQAWPTKPLVWLLEGDFIQYTDKMQSNPFTLADLGSLTTDIVCAIKSNMPNAVVAINHSSWIRNPQLMSYFAAMPMQIIDMVWTTGMGNVQGGYLNTTDSYNRSDGTYAYLYGLTGKNLLVDTSFGASQAEDTWTTTPVATLDQRIADGVIAVNVTTSPGPSSSTIGALEPQLSSTCR